MSRAAVRIRAGLRVFHKLDCKIGTVAVEGLVRGKIQVQFEDGFKSVCPLRLAIYNAEWPDKYCMALFLGIEEMENQNLPGTRTYPFQKMLDRIYDAMKVSEEAAYSCALEVLWESGGGIFTDWEYPPDPEPPVSEQLALPLDLTQPWRGLEDVILAIGGCK